MSMANKIIVRKADRINGAIRVPGDKSISQRAIMIGSIAEGVTEAGGLLMGDDCAHAINAFKAMGVRIKTGPQDRGQGTRLIIKGRGLHGLKKPKRNLYIGNSGTTMRILSGILAGQEFECVLEGDKSLSKRPMKRVVAPLKAMGASINSKPKTQTEKQKNRKIVKNDIFPPLVISGRYPLKAIKYKLPVPSAQVKSAVLLAGLYADGITEVAESVKSRDHTERMLRKFGADITVKGLKVSVRRSVLRSAGRIDIPGDISSAAFFIVAALILRSSKLIIKDTGINPTRTGLLDILKKMGADIDIRISNAQKGSYEPAADITVKSSRLKGVVIEGDIMPRLIDELPVLMVAAAFADGDTVIKGAGELRIKETDRIFSMSTNLIKMGADIKIDGDDIIINGKNNLIGSEVDSFGDHRTAMSMVIAGLRAEGRTTVLNTDCINKSFPGFKNQIFSLIV